MIGLGSLPDPLDDRDWRFSDIETPLLGATPSTVPPLMEAVGSALNQGNLGSCVAHAVAKAIFASHKRQGVRDPQLASRLALYYLSRASHQMQHFDSGTFTRSTFRVLNALGFAPEEAWPYRVYRFADMPPGEVFSVAMDQASFQKPTRYYRIHESGLDRVRLMKRAIAAGFPVVFGTNVDDNFLDYLPGSRGIFEIPASAENGHCMLACGYDPDGVDVLNSHGVAWGEGGWCRMSWEYMAWERTRDLWVAEHSPPYEVIL